MSTMRPITPYPNQAMSRLTRAKEKERAMQQLPPVMDLLTVLVKAAQGPLPVYRIAELRNGTSLHTTKLCIHHLRQKYGDLFRKRDPNNWMAWIKPTDEEILKGMTSSKHENGYICGVMLGYSCMHCNKEQRRRQKQAYQEAFRQPEAWGEKPIHKR